MADLSAGDERFRGDHGGADPVVATALAAYAAGTGGEHAALSALAGSRLLVPVVAVLAAELAGADGTTGPGAHGRVGSNTAAGESAAAGVSAAAGGSAAAGVSAAAGEKASEMAMPKIIGRDGRQAMPAFTCLEAVQQWKPAARPVPVPASAVWQSAVQESCAVVIDIAGPVPIVVEGSRLAALAVGGAVPGMHEDPDVWQQVAAAAADVAPGIRVRLSQPNGGLDFTLELAPPAGSPGLVPEDVASRVADAVHDRLPGRIRAGIAVLRRPG